MHHTWPEDLGNAACYVLLGFSRYESLMNKLGKHSTGKSCLYMKSLDDIDRKVLSTLIERSVADLRKSYV